MESITKIVKASAVGIFCGAAYIYFLKKSNHSPTKLKDMFNIESNSLDELPQHAIPIIIEKLSNIEDLSKQICREINLRNPSETLKKSLSMTLLERLNNNSNVNIYKTISDTVSNLSIRTKNERFLYKFISSNGLSMLSELVLDNNFHICLNDDVNMTLSEIIANISQKKESLFLMKTDYMTKLFASWLIDCNIVLNLNVVKIICNISQLQETNEKERVIYSPDIFLLDHEKNISQQKTYDVVFINGMLGSVYFTWRQYDVDNDVDIDTGEKTKCWPRDWLSLALPRARVIGINALLRPFVWNPMSDIDKMNRAIEDRAVEIALKLEMAGVGERPILWVTHSAGGILLKHILHISQTKPLALATKGIMFMSTPHSGAQSLLGLYYFPFKYLLTPEAKHLETNSVILLELNNWFKDFVKEQEVEILTLTETEPTKINKFYSTIIVPKCDGEFDGHKQLNVKSNHLYISKPKNQSDEIYLAVLDFIRNVMEK